ncbi:MAG: DUF6882 domain-containing protein [Sphingobacterium sp.]
MSLATPKLDESFHVLHEKAHEFVSDQEESLKIEYGFGQHDGYRVNWETSEIDFLQAEEIVVTFNFQIVGRLTEETNKWTWHWHESTLSSQEQEELNIIRNYGDFYDFTYLTEPELEAKTPLAWALTAISAYLRGAKGVFRIQDEKGDLYVYLRESPSH